MQKIMIFILLLSFSTGNYAKSRALKCPYGFIQTGDLKFTVLEKCGEPLQVDKISGDNDLKIERATYKINKWVYSFLFRAGRLDYIERSK